jgi:hypothetical protein
MNYGRWYKYQNTNKIVAKAEHDASPSSAVSRIDLPRLKADPPSRSPKQSGQFASRGFRTKPCVVQPIMRECRLCPHYLVKHGRAINTRAPPFSSFHRSEARSDDPPNRQSAEEQTAEFGKTLEQQCRTKTVGR